MLSNEILPDKFSWKVKILSISGWIAVGVISSNLAMGFCFAEKNQHNKLLNQCAISSNGANDDYIRKIKREGRGSSSRQER